MRLAQPARSAPLGRGARRAARQRKRLPPRADGGLFGALAAGLAGGGALAASSRRANNAKLSIITAGAALAAANARLAEIEEELSGVQKELEVRIQGSKGAHGPIPAREDLG